MKKEDFFEVLGELDGGVVTDAKPAAREHRAPDRVIWGAAAACLALLLALGLWQTGSFPFNVSTPAGMYKLGTAWQTDRFTFCVVDTPLCHEYRTGDGEVFTPEDGSVFVAVEYRAVFAQDASLSKCVLRKGDVYSEDHAAYTGPIRLADDEYVLLFPVSLSEADTPETYTLSVEIDAGGRTYAKNFSLVR